MLNTFALLIPCYNAAKFLPRLFETVHAQTSKFDEIICFDDGSIDDTLAVAKKLGARVIRNDQNQGPAYARNQLAKATQCSWLHFHDADDLMHASFLEKMRVWATHEFDVIVADIDWIAAETGEILIPHRYLQREFDLDPVSYMLTHPIGSGNALLRRELFFNIRGFDESLNCWEDGDLHTRLAAAGARFRALEEVLATALRHDRGISTDQKNCERCRLRCLQRYAQEFDSSLRPVIAAESERTAAKLLILGDREGARNAIEFCQLLGGDPPHTKNPVLKALKSFLPPLWLLSLQHSVRKRTV